MRALTLSVVAMVVVMSAKSGALAAEADRLVAVPINLTAQTSGGQVSLTWQAGDGIAPDGFRLEAGSAPGLTDRAIVNVPWGPRQGLDARFAASGVAPGVYYLRVRAVTDSMVSEASNEVVLRVGQSACPIPDAPGHVVARVDHSIVTLTWDSPLADSARAAGYVIEAGSTPGAPTVAILALIQSTQIALSAPPGRYFVRMRALGLCGTSEPSPELQVIVP